jgi:hypothetical protein
VLFRPDADDTLGAMARSRAVSQQFKFVVNDPWCGDTLGLDEREKQELREVLRHEDKDPVVSQIIAATCGSLYIDLVGRLSRYPIPICRLSEGSGRVMVALGCNWGRWCFAASRMGFLTIGVDRQIGALWRPGAWQSNLGWQLTLFARMRAPFAPTCGSCGSGVLLQCTSAPLPRGRDESGRVSKRAMKSGRDCSFRCRMLWVCAVPINGRDAASTTERV